MNDNDELLDLAYPYALEALAPDEFAEIEDRLAHASPATRAAFDRKVAEIRETMADLSDSTAVDPPASLRRKVLDSIDKPARSNVVPLRHRWTLAVAGLAAALALFGGSLVVVNRMNQPTEITLAQSVTSAPDRQVREVPITGGGVLEVTFSRHLDAAVVRFKSAVSVASGKAYQLWYIDGSPKSAGVVGDPGKEITVAKLGTSTALALTIEPAAGSKQPTMTPIAVANL
ncbi:RskA family anti-sigma factor [Smaragdicoccus niigatensis]|uniref:anti-sigma factor n=1 Tax=Smaragdicoccus niigatensis TaxID=359359 RepID=UPI00035C1F1A|nr:anti-sigma factor [Smaragdicoccus niigatensis]